MLATLLAILLCVGSEAIGGAFFAFSSFVMRALSPIASVLAIASPD